ncbi:MAG TPA: ABC transporter permease [Chloroflexota bacterium]|jgi:ABC-type dipeptide/oligopeptide/nickel transport system permease component
MRTYLVRRLLTFIPSMLVVYTLVFGMIHATPGNPWDAGEKPFPPQVLQNLEAKYHYNDPIWKQYGDYLWGIVTRFDFGPSFKRGVTANEVIARFLPVSVQLGLLAFGIASVAGVLLGSLAAVRHNTWIDRVAMFGAVFGVSTPSYVFITILIVALAVQLRWVPTGGWGGVADSRIIIPAIALALMPTAAIARYTRASILEVLGMDYVRTARAKGLREWVVLNRHSLPNALIPVVTVAGVALADLITGSFFVEAIYQVPGIGRYFVTTVQDKDYPVLMAVTLMYATIIWVTNFVVDVLYSVLDPRVRLT